MLRCGHRHSNPNAANAAAVATLAEEVGNAKMIVATVAKMEIVLATVAKATVAKAKAKMEIVLAVRMHPRGVTAAVVEKRPMKIIQTKLGRHMSRCVHPWWIAPQPVSGRHNDYVLC